MELACPELVEEVEAEAGNTDHLNRQATGMLVVKYLFFSLSQEGVFDKGP